jgi:hypothetical protein
MIVDKGAHVVVTSFKDVDGNEWTEGDIVVQAFGISSCNQGIIFTLFEMINMLILYFPT